MKNQETDISFTSETTKQLQKVQFKQIKCSKNKKSDFACLNKSCQKYAFICLDKSCQCMKEHRQCLNIYVESLKNSLYSKVILLDEFLKQICQKIDETINDLSNFRQEIEKKVKTDFVHHGLSPAEVLLINSLQTGNVKKITGKQIWQAHLNTQKQLKKIHATNDFEKQILSIWSDHHQKTKQCTKIIQEKLQKFKITSSQQPLSNQRRLDQEIMFKDSKLLESTQKRQKICKFFQDKNIKAAKLLYRASENGFDTSNFHGKCDNINNTLTICQTQFGKVIGGFTPLIWTSPASGQNVNDETGQSFIFSLTNNHKFKLQTGKSAIYRVSTIGPTFGNGGPDFYINNNANTSTSYANICQSYINQSYKKGQKQSWQRFCGSPSNYSFKTKEWQVWQLQFSS